MFIDEKALTIRAGKGGDGVALFRREIYVPRGGADGGDGGKGGDVYLVAQPNTHALTHLAGIEKIEAEDGLKGGHRRSTGKSGSRKDVIVPLGTAVEELNPETGLWEPVIELLEKDQEFRIAKGGNGGWGNWHFKTSVQQAPERSNPGQPGEEKRIRLTLKLIADIGLVGLPNAGKSSFLAAVSAAEPKIANYPFTTLEPQLGIAQVSFGSETYPLIIADIPGLIEGASAGKGLGTAFLKHIERTKVILHLVDVAALDEVVANYRLIRQELSARSEALATKPEIIVLSKVDQLSETEIKELTALLRAAAPESRIMAISSHARLNLDALLTEAAKFAKV